MVCRTRTKYQDSLLCIVHVAASRLLYSVKAWLVYRYCCLTRQDRWMITSEGFEQPCCRSPAGSTMSPAGWSLFAACRWLCNRLIVVSIRWTFVFRVKVLLSGIEVPLVWIIAAAPLQADELTFRHGWMTTGQGWVIIFPAICVAVVQQETADAHHPAMKRFQICVFFQKLYEQSQAQMVRRCIEWGSLNLGWWTDVIRKL